MNKSIKNIFFFNFIIIPVYSFLKLYFQTDIAQLDNINEKEKFLQNEKNEIYINLLIGTPPQKIKVYLKFSSYYFFISNDTLNNFYNEKISKTFKSLEGRSFGYLKEPFLKGQKSSDNIEMEDIKENKKTKIQIPNFQFILATGYLKDNKKISGGIGLKLKEKDNDNLDFIHLLKNEKIINSFYWSILYINNNEGYLYIGGLPHEFDNNYDSYYLRNTNPDIKLNDGLWYLNFDKMTFGNFSLVRNNRFELKIESGFIYGNYEILYLIENNFFKEYIEKKICFKNLSSYEEEDSFNFFYCNQLTIIKNFPEIKLFQRNLNITFILNYEDLFEKIGNNFYLLIVFSRQNLNNWVLGKPFFKKYQLIFEPDKKNILSYFGFPKKENHLNSYIIFFIIFLLILFISLIIFKIFFFSSKKLKAIELEDTNNYMNIM